MGGVWRNDGVFPSPLGVANDLAGVATPSFSNERIIYKVKRKRKEMNCRRWALLVHLIECIRRLRHRRASKSKSAAMDSGWERYIPFSQNTWRWTLGVRLELRTFNKRL
jgi:hypothetical protein